MPGSPEARPEAPRVHHRGGSGVSVRLDLLVAAALGHLAQPIRDADRERARDRQRPVRAGELSGRRRAIACRSTCRRRPSATSSGEQIPLNVVFEDEDLVVVDKAAGMVVHPAPGNWTGTLVNALMGRGNDLPNSGDADRAGIVHRLDKDTSGLLLVAKTDRAHRTLSAGDRRAPRGRDGTRPCVGPSRRRHLTVDKPIARDPRDRKRMAIVSSGRSAKTDFLRLARFDATRSAARAPPHGPHASDSCASRVGRASGRRRRHLRRRGRATAAGTAAATAFSARSVAALSAPGIR